MKKFDISEMPPLPGDIRELALFRLQDALKILNEVEQMLCLEEDEEPEETE
jgi:hypothetical protein